MIPVRHLPARELAVAVSGWLALASMHLPPGTLRYVVVAVFVLWCPGSAVMGRWPLPDGLERAVLNVAVSLCLAVVVAEMQAFAGLWNPSATIGLLAVITTGSVLIRARCSSRCKEVR